jgi:hypothetical protein
MEQKGEAYLLVDKKIHVVARHVEVPLRLLDGSTLLEYLAVQRQLFLARKFSLLGQVHQLSSVLQLDPQSLQLLDNLGISAASLASLPDFTAAETDVWIGIVRVYVAFVLERRHQRVILRGQATLLPVVVNLLGEEPGGVIDCFVKRCFHFGKGQDGGIVDCGKWLL